MRKIVSLVVLGLGLLSFTTARADGPVSLSVQAAGSSVTYHVVHKFHKVDGVSKSVEGRARIQPGGVAQVMVRVAIQSFDSGNVNRDAHMKEVTEAEKYPAVEVKAVGDGVVIPTTFPSTVDKTMKAQVNFHGITQTFDIPVHIVFTSATAATATTSFMLSLDAYKVERPSLAFIKIDDALKIDATLVLGS
jgi:hypothetical protein